MGLGKKLKAILDSKGMTVSELARVIHIAPTTLFSLINRDGNKIDIELLIRICNALNITPDIFAEKYENEPINLAAHFDGDEYTEEELEEIKQFAEFVKSKRKDD